jgi:hypothetical protein
MKKKIYDKFFFFVSIFFTLLTALLFYQNTQMKQNLFVTNLRAETYARANGKNIAWQKVKQYPKMYLNLENEIGIPKKILQSIKSHENGSTVIEFGVKKIPIEVIEKENPEEWQARAAAKIAIQEAFKLILSDKKLQSEYFKVLGSRYCNHDKVSWAKETEILYKKLEGIND